MTLTKYLLAAFVCTIFNGLALPVRYEVQQEESSSVAEHLEQIIQGQLACWNRGDLDGFMKPYWKSDQLAFCTAGSVTRGWQAMLDFYKRSYRGGDRELMGTLQFDEMETTVLGDDAALVMGHWKIQTSNRNYEGRFSLIWQKRNGEWKIIHDHSSLKKAD